MMAKKRIGGGGNAAIDPRNNPHAQKKYALKHGKKTKSCTGFIHFDGPEIPISNFRQQKGNQGTGLQSRCDLCNRLYFSIIQKPTKRIAAIVIWSEISSEYNWRIQAPAILKPGIEKCLNHWKTNPCSINNCLYEYQHSDYRQCASVLTASWTDMDKGNRNSIVTDYKTGETLEAPEFMAALQSWAGPEGILSKQVDNSQVWNWWCSIFPADTATDSAERRVFEANPALGATPKHPLTSFSWGAGNILNTDQGHSVPGFNQVKASARILKRASSAANRAYGYLVEGNRAEMMKFSKECKELGMSLGHSPAPLRWLGKDDPINGVAQPLKENVLLRDSLVDLHKIALHDPTEASKFVSWQIREVVIKLGVEKVNLQEFTQQVSSEVEKYLDSLLIDIEKNNSKILKSHLVKADPGKTKKIYTYREHKIKEWLYNRPNARYALK